MYRTALIQSGIHIEGDVEVRVQDPLEACAEHRFDHLAVVRVMLLTGTESCSELQMMLMARETTNPIRIKAKTDSIIMRNFARCDKGMVSVGLKAVAPVKAT